MPEVINLNATSDQQRSQTVKGSVYKEAQIETLAQEPDKEFPQINDSQILSLNARKITSGKLQSSDGTTFFDLDNDYILINDDTTNRMLLGKNPNTGTVQMKLSQPGIDVLTGDDNQMIWSDQFNMFKIGLTGQVTLTVPNGYSAGTIYSVEVPHAFGQEIAATAFVDYPALIGGERSNIPVSVKHYAGGLGAYVIRADISMFILPDKIRFVFLGDGTPLFEGDYVIRYYILLETAV